MLLAMRQRVLDAGGGISVDTKKAAAKRKRSQPASADDESSCTLSNAENAVADDHATGKPKPCLNLPSSVLLPSPPVCWA